MMRRLALILTLAATAVAAACTSPTGPSGPSTDGRANMGVFAGSGA